MSLALVLVAGEVAGFAFGRMAPAWPWGMGVVAMAALAAWGWRMPHVLVPLVFALGMVAAARVEHARSEALERHWRSAVDGKAPVLDLVVEGRAEERTLRKRGRVVQFFSHLGPTPLKVVLPRDGLARMPAGGEVWRCRGWISRSSGMNGRFSRRMFWGREGKLVAGAMPGRIERAKDFFARLGDRCARKAEVGLGWCQELAALNQAILLGRRVNIPHARREIFVAAGTVHVFAISGLHVMLVAWMFANVLSLLGISTRHQGALILPVLVAYTLLTGARPSAVRAAMMAGMYLLAMVVGRKGDSLSAWSVTALLVYGIYPERVYDVGCTFSFVVMLGIVAWMRWTQGVTPDTWRREWMESLGVSFAAWAAGVPIAAHVFGKFTLGGLVANLAVLRLAPMTVAFGMLGMLSGFVCESVAAVLNNLAAMSTFLMALVSTLVASLPVASVEVVPWSFVVCAAWYAATCGGVFLVGRVLVRRQVCWWRG